jgi:hypothetical protein
LRRFTLACVGLLAICVSATGAPQAATGTTAAPETRITAARQLTAITHELQAAKTAEAAKQAAIRWLSRQVFAYEQETWRWEKLMGVPRTPTAGRVLAEMSVPDVRNAAALWKQRAKRARLKARRPPHLQQFLCIHRFEGSWQDGGGPYYGGLQMDIGFQAAYGGHLLRAKGTADHWTPLEQIWVAENAARSRGFWPWPNTARFCCLI